MDMDRYVYSLISIFKKSGKDELSISDAINIVSFRLNWCPPTEAKKFINVILNNSSSIYEKNEDIIKLKKDYENIEIPSTFHHFDDKEIEKIIESAGPPDTNIKEDIFNTISSSIATKINFTTSGIVGMIDKISVEKKIYREVVELYFAYLYNIDVSLISSLNEHINNIYFKI
ncbi:MAG: DUF2240 family protein [Candidatus Thermoplasmatota archaeon]|jgi:hypothetical protein|nr:DUF2240 family protein [Candidatus Thermoplasmatota archaeon]MCL5963248.1 DUF2240 family protein [Candidatus Thermoplasmatota archaeon]